MGDCDRGMRAGDVQWRGGEGCASLGACGMCGCLKEVLLQALADQQVRQSSLRAHPALPPCSAGYSGR